MSFPNLPTVLVYPLKKLWISAGINGHKDKTGHVETEGHDYNAYDWGYFDSDPSCPEDSGPNPRLYAMADGVVLSIVNDYPDYYTNTGYGNYIIIKYPKLNFVSVYAHIKKDSFMVKVGDSVRQGQPVCRMDNSGWSFGHHLHMEICRGIYFNRHNGIDYVTEGVVYTMDWHYIDPDTVKRYTLARMIIEPTDKDITKNQVHVTGNDLRIRKAPIDGEIVGFCVQGYYDYTETTEGDGYTWCKVGDYWVAGDTDVSELCPATFVPTEPNPLVDQVEVTITDLRIRLEPSTSSTIMGFAPIGYYDVEESRSEEDYVWFKVCGYWIAFVEGVIYHGSQEDPKDKEIAELKAEIELLHEVVDEQKTKIEYQEWEIKELNEQIETQTNIIHQQIDDFTEIRYLAAKNIPE